jgi:hypothetical protein
MAKSKEEKEKNYKFSKTKKLLISILSNYLIIYINNIEFSDSSQIPTVKPYLWFAISLNVLIQLYSC